jgi:hypothetical protein
MAQVLFTAAPTQNLTVRWDNIRKGGASVIRHRGLIGRDLDATNLYPREQLPVQFQLTSSITSVPLVHINHDYNGVGFHLDTAATTADSFQWTVATTTGICGDWQFNTVTTGTGVKISADGLLSGGVALHVISNSSSTATRSMVLFENDNTASVSTTVLELQQDANEPPIALTGAGTFTQTTVGSAGSASALPAQPTAYIQIQIKGTDFVIPYYAIS